jgi:FkbM family methyltransferase
MNIRLMLLSYLRKFTSLLRRVRGSILLLEPIRKRFLALPLKVTIQDFDKDLKLEIDVSDEMGGRIYWYGAYNRDLFALLRRQLRIGMVFFDVGANIGEVTIFAAKYVGPTGRVVAFEPNPDVAVSLERNVAINDFEHVKVVRAGLLDKEATMPIYTPLGRNGGMTTLYPRGDLFTLARTVSLITLDDFVAGQGISQLDGIKIDVEGAEIAVLQGASETIQKYRPWIIVEVQQETAGAAGYRAEDILRLLYDWGYSFKLIGRHGQLFPTDDLKKRHLKNVLCTPNKQLK